MRAKIEKEVTPQTGRRHLTSSNMQRFKDRCKNATNSYR